MVSCDSGPFLTVKFADKYLASCILFVCCNLVFTTCFKNVFKYLLSLLFKLGFLRKEEFYSYFSFFCLPPFNCINVAFLILLVRKRDFEPPVAFCAFENEVMFIYTEVVIHLEAAEKAFSVVIFSSLFCVLVSEADTVNEILGIES